MQHKSLADLAKAYAEAKQKEDAATEARVAIGEQIAIMVHAPDEGQTTLEADGYSVTVRSVVNRRVDWTAFDAVIKSSKIETPPVKTKKELDVPGLKWFRDNSPEQYAALAKTITATPGRSQIKVEVKK
jgi:hypothetical protein